MEKRLVNELLPIDGDSPNGALETVDQNNSAFSTSRPSGSVWAPRSQILVGLGPRVLLDQPLGDIS